MRILYIALSSLSFPIDWIMNGDREAFPCLGDFNIKILYMSICHRAFMRSSSMKSGRGVTLIPCCVQWKLTVIQLNLQCDFLLLRLRLTLCYLRFSLQHTTIYFQKIKILTPLEGLSIYVTAQNSITLCLIVLISLFFKTLVC